MISSSSESELQSAFACEVAFTTGSERRSTSPVDFLVTDYSRNQSTDIVQGVKLHNYNGSSNTDIVRVVEDFHSLRTICRSVTAVWGQVTLSVLALPFGNPWHLLHLGSVPAIIGQPVPVGSQIFV